MVRRHGVDVRIAASHVGAFTSIRIVSGSDGRGWFLFRFWGPRRCGRHYAIEAVYSNSCGYELTKSDTDDTFAVPFDACMFVSRDTSPEFRERFDVYI